MYDAIFVGVHYARASTTMVLGRKGYKVLLVDRTIFPKLNHEKGDRASRAYPRRQKADAR